MAEITEKLDDALHRLFNGRTPTDNIRKLRVGLSRHIQEIKNANENESDTITALFEIGEDVLLCMNEPLSESHVRNAIAHLNTASRYYSNDPDSEPTHYRPNKDEAVPKGDSRTDKTRQKNLQESFGRRSYGYMIDFVIFYALERVAQRRNKQTLFELLNSAGFPIQDDVLTTKIHRHKNRNQFISWDGKSQPPIYELTQQGGARLNALLQNGAIPQDGIDYIQAHLPEIDRLIQNINKPQLIQFSSESPSEEHQKHEEAPKAQLSK